MTSETSPTFRSVAAAVPRMVAPLALLVILLVFGAASPYFLTVPNLTSVLSQNALLLLAAIAMTVVVRAGGIDLSVGVAIDIAALVTASLLFDGYVAWFAVAWGIAAGLAVGAANAFLGVVLRIRPFLATLSVWFIGVSVQQVATGGGAPIYLAAARTPADFQALSKGSLLGIAVPVLIAIALLLVTWLALERSRWGRVLTAAGDQPTATRISGRLAGTSVAAAYVSAAGIAAVAGIALAARSDGFVAGSGQLYVLDSIGAVFIGATLSRSGRPNLGGTLVSVLIFGLLTNGMNLIGLSFYWHGLARGAVLLAILLIGVALARASDRRAVSFA